MDVPTRIRRAQERLKADRRVNRITVRDFLRHFDAERRGTSVVAGIRRVLDSLDLKTDPDFESAWIDAPIRLCLKDEIAAPPENHEVNTDDGGEDVLSTIPTAVQQAEQQAEDAPVLAEGSAVQVAIPLQLTRVEDPTYRIGNFPAANKSLIVVNRQDSLQRAASLMLQHEVSQLPVMQGDREVSGVVTWKSIGSLLVSGCGSRVAGDYIEKAQIIDSNCTLFDAIAFIVDHGYVLVKNIRDRRITGIVTASDLSLEFLQLAQPFLLLKEIELQIRNLLHGNVTTDDLSRLDTLSLARPVGTDLEKLTLGQYIRLMQHPQTWNNIGLAADRVDFINTLETVREIRNEVMLFNPDPLDTDAFNKLRSTVRYLQQLSDIKSVQRATA